MYIICIMKINLYIDALNVMGVDIICLNELYRREAEVENSLVCTL